MEHQITLPGQIDERRRRVQRLRHGTLWFTEHWLLLFAVLFGMYWIAPFFAPVFMHIGWTGPANLIYTVYSTQCHQMAQRSFFLFGPQPMYNIAQLPVPSTGDGAADMLALRAFVGNSNLGWKVAWSDRMVYMYGGVWLAALVFGLRRHRQNIRPLKWYFFGLLLLPMAIDGGTHMLSDMTGSLAGGFRYDNQWLADLTGHILPTWFYMGDTLGSFNSWMRLISGLLFGIACVWLSFPYLDSAMKETAAELREKLE